MTPYAQSLAIVLPFSVILVVLSGLTDCRRGSGIDYADQLELEDGFIAEDEDQKVKEDDNEDEQEDEKQNDGGWQGQASSDIPQVSAEELKSDAFLSMLEMHSDSTFWTATADGLARYMLQARARAEESNGGDGGMGSLLETSLNTSAMAELEDEDDLVRNAVMKAVRRVDPHRFSDDKEALLSCARHMIGNDKEDGSDVYSVDDKGKQLDNGIHAPSKGRHSIFKDVMGSVNGEIRQLRMDFKEFADFFYTFLRWEIQWKVIDTKTSLFGITNWLPQIGFKCQPLFECVRQLVNVPKAFLKMIASLIRVVGAALWALVKRLAKYLGIRFGKHEAEERLRETAHMDVTVQLASADGQAPHSDSVNKFVDEHNSQLFDDYIQTAGECQTCQGRLKGSFGIDVGEMITGLAMGNLKSILGSFSLWITTVPRPLQNQLTNCVSCLKKFKEDAASLFVKNDRTPTTKYFAKGQCNAHTVGLCMMLEKTRACGVTLNNEKGKEIEMESGGATRHSKQIKFCDSFKGVTLRLTQTDQQGIRCPEEYRDKIWEQRGLRVKMNDSAVTRLDLEYGCQAVRRTLKSFNRQCERDFVAKDEKRRLFGRFKRAMSNSIGKYAYENAREINSLDDIVHKCRTLYNCKDEEDGAPAANTRVNWKELQRSIQGIVSQVDDFQGKPQSYQPATATKEILRLIEQSTHQWTKFSDKVSRKLTDTKKSNGWGKQYSRLFLSHLWDDRCFNGLHPLVDDRLTRPARAVSARASGRRGQVEAFELQVDSQARPLQALYARIGHPAPTEEKSEANDFKFFRSMASALGVERWDEANRCKLDWNPPSLPPPPVRTHISGPKMDLLVASSIGRWVMGWQIGQLRFQAFDVSASGFKDVELVRIPRQGCVDDCGPGDWFVKSCVGSVCSGARSGSVLVNMTVQGSLNKATQHFAENSQRFLVQMHRGDQLLLLGGEEAKHAGLPVKGNVDFQDALKVTHRWEKAVLTKAAKVQKWEVGQMVEVRDQDYDPWFKGKVASVDPLLVDWKADGRILRDTFKQFREPQKPYVEGEEVDVKDVADDEWRCGKVVSVDPLLVLGAGRIIAREYHIIRHKASKGDTALLRTRVGNGMVDYASSVLNDMRPLLQRSPQLRQFFHTRGWTLQDKGLDVHGETEVEFHVSGSPVATMSLLTDVVRLLSRPHLEAQRNIRMGVVDMGNALVLRSSIHMLYNGSDAGLSNPFEELRNQDQNFAESGKGIARVQLEFMSPEEQSRRPEYDYGARKVKVLKKVRELFGGGSRTAASAVLRAPVFKAKDSVVKKKEPTTTPTTTTTTASTTTTTTTTTSTTLRRTTTTTTSSSQTSTTALPITTTTTTATTTTTTTTTTASVAATASSTRSRGLKTAGASGIRPLPPDGRPKPPPGPPPKRPP